MATIPVREETRKKLARLRAVSQESYDEVLNRLLALVPEGDDEGLYTQTFRGGLLTARHDVRERRVNDHKEVKRRLGL